MKLIDSINKAKETLFSFELLPPRKGHNIEKIFNAIDPLLEFDPFAINVTYHQEELEYKKLENGLLEPRKIRKRPGTVAISAAIKCKYPDITVVPHLICGGFTKEETEYALIDFNFLGIDNLLLLRGDPIKTERFFKPEKGGNAHAIDLVKQVTDMNKGKYLDENLKNTSATNFCVGVAGYPEKHYEAANMDTDLKYLKQKVDAGADYIVTQMFFDNQKFFEFEKKCREIGIDVPIIPGMKPVSTIKEIKVLPRVFSIDIPDALCKEIEKCKDNKQAWEVGIEWTIQQSRELVKHGSPVLHYYTIGKSENIRRVAKEVF